MYFNYDLDQYGDKDHKHVSLLRPEKHKESQDRKKLEYPV